MTFLNRRQLLQLSGSAFASSLLPLTVMAAEKPLLGKTLVLVEFNGGNDGLNTVIPFQDPAYYAARPTIQIPKKQQLPLTDELAFHPSLKPLEEIWQQDQMATVLGVGYAQPNRSHFRSIEIWDTASKSDEYLQDGWLAKSRGDAYFADAIVIGRNTAPVSSADTRTIVIDSIEGFYQQSTQIERVDSGTQNTTLATLLKVHNDTKQAGEQLKQLMAASSNPLPEFSGGIFGQQLREVARLILMGNAAPVIKVALGSFDTHQAQLPTQAQLLSDFAQALADFHSVMAAQGLWQDVMVMTYSEFGRRVAENGSGGTDHGTAAPHFVMGGAVKGGFYGTQPSLTELNRGDLIHTTEMTSYYQTIASGFLAADVRLSNTRLGFV